jgi:YjbE family integral membrane protein
VIVSCLGPILGILLIDLILSGDNAVVIGAAASGLPRQQRMIALIVGGGGAVVSRIVLALAATLLLQLRFIGIIGGIILLFIALRLLTERSTERRVDHSEFSPIVKPLPNKNKPQTELPHIQLDQPVQKKRPSKSLLTSMITILLADVTMSLDNILAIGGLAGGNIVPLVIGLVFSVIFLLVGSALVAEFISRLPWLLDLACLIVAWTAAQIFLGDDSLNEFFTSFPWIPSSASVIAPIIVLITDILLRIRDHHINYPNKL